MTRAVDRVIELTKELIAVEMRRDDLRKQIEELMVVPAGAPAISTALPVPDPDRRAVASITVGRAHTFLAPGPSGFTGEVFRYMCSNPDREFSPEHVATALGQPEKKGLASTAMSRLLSKGELVRRRPGMYLYPSTAPINFEKER